MTKEETGMSGALKASIACLVIGCVVMVLSLFMFFIYVPLFIASFILSIVAMANDEVWAGIGMLVGNILIPSAIFGLMLAIGLNNLENSDNAFLDSFNDSSKDLQTENSSEGELTKQQGPTLDELRNQYLTNIELTNVEAKYYKSFGGKEPGISFKIKNEGDSTLSYVKVTAYFKNNTGDTIYEKDFTVINSSSLFGDSKPLKPNYIHQVDGYYSVAGVPDEWKEGSVEAKISEIEFSK